MLRVVVRGGFEQGGEGGCHYDEGFNCAVESAQPDIRGFAAGQHIRLKLAGRWIHQLSVLTDFSLCFAQCISRMPFFNLA